MTAPSLPAGVLRPASRVLPLLLLVLLWQLVLSAGLLDPDFLPSPAATARALVELLATPSFYPEILATFGRSLAGLLLGVVLGVPVGAVMAISRRGESFFGPLVKATYSLPKTSLVPLFMLWFGIGNTMSISAVAFSAVLPVIVYTYHGIRNTPQVLVWGARAMGTRPAGILWRVQLPAALHDILTGTRIALGFSFVIAISAEMIAARVGAGKLIFLYGENGSYDFMFAAVAGVVALACLADAGLVLLAERLLRWRDPDARQI